MTYLLFSLQHFTIKFNTDSKIKALKLQFILT